MLSCIDISLLYLPLHFHVITHIYSVEVIFVKHTIVNKSMTKQ